MAGDDIKGGSIALTMNADRILDVIAASGGALSPNYQAQVKVIRGGQEATVGLQAVLNNPAENARLHPRDIVVVSKNPGVFTVLGAVTAPAQEQFTYDHVSLAQAIGMAGGLLDARADVRGVFVFRYEVKEAADRICGSCAEGAAGAVPIIYRLDMKQPNSLFIAQKFAIQDHDVLFVANAPRVELQKFLTLLGSLTSPILTGVVAGRSVN